MNVSIYRRATNGRPAPQQPEGLAMQKLQRALARSTAAVGVVAALTVAVAATAAAHVTIHPDENTAGSYAKITVRVPNESDTAGTNELRLDLPADSPFPSVQVQPQPGWSAEITTEQFDEPVEVGDFTLDEAVTSITWTAENGNRIDPGEFEEFAISVGPLPEAGTYLFPATQTYDDGEVVAWDMEPNQDEEPPNPAPELTVLEQGADPEGGTDAATETTEASDDAGNASADNLARGLGIAGIVIGTGGLATAAATLRRHRQSNSPE